MNGFVYILYSNKTNKYYIGSTNHLDRRLDDHNKGNTPSTSFGRPWQLRYFQEFGDIKIARKIELKLKRYKSRAIIEKIISSQKITAYG